MLREVPNAWFAKRLTAVGTRFLLVEGEKVAAARWRRRRFRALTRSQQLHPVTVSRSATGTLWAFEGRIYREDEGLGPDDVMALVRERERRRRRRLERAHAAMAAERSPDGRRDPLTREVRQHVWRRDRGRCVQCGTDFELQFDHVIPICLGGASTPENLQVLCADCNRSKGAGLA